MRNRWFCLIIYLLIGFSAFGQTRIGFFSSVSDSSDLATISLTEDLYYSKATVLSDYIIKDYRTSFYVEDNLSEFNDIDFIFYPEIQENGIGWKCIFHAINLQTKEKFKNEKDYDSYYPILIDANNEITNFFKLITSNNSSKTTESKSLSSAILSIENLAGSWKGENYIDKIIILRSGRGFVIHKNGASMNILLEVNGNQLIATQSSNSNASFLPELPRDIALEFAPQAKPIKWIFTISSATELTGSKATYCYIDNSVNSCEISVIWTKQ